MTTAEAMQAMYEGKWVRDVYGVVWRVSPGRSTALLEVLQSSTETAILTE